MDRPQLALLLHSEPAQGNPNWPQTLIHLFWAKRPFQPTLTFSLLNSSVIQLFSEFIPQGLRGGNQKQQQTCVVTTCKYRTTKCACVCILEVFPYMCKHTPRQRSPFVTSILWQSLRINETFKTYLLKNFANHEIKKSHEQTTGQLNGSHTRFFFLRGNCFEFPSSCPIQRSATRKHKIPVNRKSGASKSFHLFEGHTARCICYVAVARNSSVP